MENERYMNPRVHYYVFRFIYPYLIFLAPSHQYRIVLTDLISQFRNPNPEK